MSNCLYCYKELSGETGFHEKCSLEFFGTKTAPVLPYRLEQMNELAKQVVERSVTVPGIQPKLSLSLIKETKEKGDSRLTVVGALGGNYIFKPPVDKYPEMPPNEHVTAVIAKDYGIRTVPSSLIRLLSGELAYITKRIDRKENGEKIHILDMFQILEAYDKYKGSMEKIGKAIGDHSANTLLDKVFYFELVLFSFITGNNDMHLKNFSMINEPSGWMLAPAYDLLNVSIVNPDDKEELALPIEGKKKKLERDHFIRFGNGLGLNSRQIDGVFSRFLDNKPKALDWIERSFLSATMKDLYRNTLEDRYSKIY